MKDITSTSFGLVIAFLLPGLAGLYSASFWSADLKALFKAFLTAQSNVGLFLLIILAALSVGLLVTIPRWIIFELWLCRRERLEPADLATLGTEGKLAAFRAAVDEHYRYHQFWGGMTIVMPPLFLGWLRESCGTLGATGVFLTMLIFTVVEVMTGAAALAAYRIFVRRARPILKGA